MGGPDRSAATAASGRATPVRVPAWAGGSTVETMAIAPARAADAVARRVSVQPMVSLDCLRRAPSGFEGGHLVAAAGDKSGPSGIFPTRRGSLAA